MGLSGFVQSVAGVWLLMAAAIAFALACIVLPWRFARATARLYRLKWYNRWYLYPLFGIALGAPAAYMALHKQQFFGFDIYRVPSGSMSLTINPGELIVADMRTAVVAGLKPGDVVVMYSNKRPEMIVAKRIVAAPGQHVLIDDAGLRVDGQRQSRVHTQGDDKMDAKWMLFADVRLGSDEFYVMGDNRGNSFDSRTEGPVPRTNLLGKITTIYYSGDYARLGKVE
jgi:signal peptidase I